MNLSSVNVLFTSVGRRVELIRSFKRAYANLNLKGNIVAVDINPLAPALKEADRVYIVPCLSDPSYITELKKICNREQIKLIFPLIDPDIPVLSTHEKEIKESGAQPVVVSKHSVSIARDKLKTYNFFRQIGIKTPHTWSPEKILTDSIDYPVFIKPRSGSASKNTFKINNKRELEFFINYLPDPIIQEYIPGPEITNDVVCDWNGKVVTVVSRQRIEVRAGEVSKGVTIYNENIIENCKKIANSLPGVGPITVQCIMKNDEPYFTEINARLGGGVPLAIAAGVDIPAILMSCLMGISYKCPEIGEYKTGLYMTRYDESFFITESELSKIQSNRV